MCRMMGVAVRDRISPLWFDDFRTLARSGKVALGMSEFHDDGWGIAGYLGNWTVHFGRSADSAIADGAAFDTASRKAVGAGSRIVISHLRKASEGPRTLANAHPFIYKDFIFCHNGTVHNAGALAVPGFSYESDTDSERLFKFIVHRLEGAGIGRYEESIRRALDDVRTRCAFTSLTFLLSTPEHLIAYREWSEEEEYYTLYRAPTAAGGVVVCSEPLPGFEWTPMENRELLIADRSFGGFLA